MLVDTGQALTNVSFRSLIVGFAIVIVAFGAAGSLNLYVLTFFWQFQSEAIFVALLAGPLGSIVGYATAKRLFERFDKKRGVIIGTALWLVAHGISAPLFLLGWLPAAGSMGLLAAVCVFFVLAAIGIAYLLVGTGTMLADIADEHELLSRQRHEGIFFGTLSFTNKCSAALGSLIGGAVLDWLNWPVGSAIRTAADIDPLTLQQLGLAWGPTALILGLPGLWYIARYRLTRQRHEQILLELQAQRDPA